MAEYKGSNADGTRVQRLEKERERKREEFEQMKRELEKQSAVNAVGSISERFAGQSQFVEENLKKATIGLVSLEDFQRKQEILQQQAELRLQQQQQQKTVDERLKKKRKKAAIASKLSFSLDDGEDGDGSDDGTSSSSNGNGNSNSNGNDNDNNARDDEDQQEPKRRKFGKDPTVNTSFLPDKEREELANRERERLKQQWLEEQEVIKKTMIDVTYSYWDGSGHRRTLNVAQGTTIERFLDLVRNEFKELRATTVENLLFVKEDLIIPHHYSFYDLIVTKARGKSGPLFNWDVHEDVRVLSDARREKDESHAAKVVERRWYERNSHVFPASRWEIFDPTIKRDRYTIHGD